MYTISFLLPPHIEWRFEVLKLVYDVRMDQIKL